MLRYVSGFFSGGLDPFWPHVVLLSASVLASIAVGVGIIFERPKYSPAVHRVAFWLIVIGIAVEAVCTIFLFAFDEGISRSQNDKIITLERRVAQRVIDGPNFKKSLEGKPKAPVEIMYPKDDFEAFTLANQLRFVLIFSGWQASEPVPVPPSDNPRLMNLPSTMSVGATAPGVTIVVRADTDAEIDAFRDIKANTPFRALMDAISEALGGAGGLATGPGLYGVPPQGTLRIVVGPKP
jgi:hypothetical protein